MPRTRIETRARARVLQALYAWDLRSGESLDRVATQIWDDLSVPPDERKLAGGFVRTLIKSGAEIEKFVDRVAAEAYDAAKRDLAVGETGHHLVGGLPHGVAGEGDGRAEHLTESDRDRSERVPLLRSTLRTAEVGDHHHPCAGPHAVGLEQCLHPAGGQHAGQVPTGERHLPVVGTDGDDQAVSAQRGQFLCGPRLGPDRAGQCESVSVGADRLHGVLGRQPNPGRGRARPQPPVGPMPVVQPWSGVGVAPELATRRAGRVDDHHPRPGLGGRAGCRHAGRTGADNEHVVPISVHHVPSRVG